MNLRSIPFLVLPMLTLACGPTIEPPEDGTSGSSTGTMPPSTTVGVTTTPPPPPPGSTTSVTETTSTTAVDSSDVSDDGIIFIDEHDFGGCLVSGDGTWHCSYCDLFAQDCPEGEKCMPWANDGGPDWNATRCSPIDDNPGQPGDPCTVEGSGVSGIDDCDLGSMCWGVNPETNEGECVGMCEGDQSNPLCPPSMECLDQSNGFIVLCLPECNPLVGCDPGEACIPTDDAFVCTPVLAGAAAGEGCERFDACAPGLSCLASETVGPACDPGIPGCCTSWCNLSAPDPAAGCFDPAHECVPWWDGDAPAGLEDVGACVIPAP